MNKETQKCFICKAEGWYCRASAPGTNYREVVAPVNKWGVRIFNSIENCRIVIEQKKRRESRNR